MISILVLKKQDKKTTEDFKKESDDASSAQELAEDETWKTDVLDLKSSIAAVETLRVAVEKLNDEYVHPTTGPTASTTTPQTLLRRLQLQHRLQDYKATTTMPTTTAGAPYVSLHWSSNCTGDTAIPNEKECKAACAQTPGWEFGRSVYNLYRPGCFLHEASKKVDSNSNPTGRKHSTVAPICRAK